MTDPSAVSGWANAGVLDRLFARMQREQLIRINIEAVGDIEALR